MLTYESLFIRVTGGDSTLEIKSTTSNANTQRYRFSFFLCLCCWMKFVVHSFAIFFIYWITISCYFCSLTASQLAIGLTVFVFHAITTAINDHFFNQIAIYKKSLYNLDFGYYYEEELVDHASTGVWVGLLVSLIIWC